MSLWKYLWDDDYKQRDDINALQGAQAASDTMTSRANRKLDRLEQRLNQLELTVHGIYRVLEKEGSINTAQFRELLVQVDLEDGREDGRIGKDRTAKAPKCQLCGKPINKKRDECVFCGEPLESVSPGPYRK